MPLKKTAIQSNGCYWCGKPATSVEHVPPSNLFPPGHNSNLITVPSCKKHNEAFHMLDERFRFYLQAFETNAIALAAFKDKTFRSLNRPDRPGLVKSLAAKSHRVIVGGQPTFAMEINPKDQYLYFEKIMRGIYFHIYKKQASGRVVSVSRKFIVPGLNYDELEQMALLYLDDPTVAVQGNTANPEIFKFTYAKKTEQNTEAFAVRLIFYEGVIVYGFLTGD